MNRSNLPNILAILTFDDGPYDPDGDYWRLAYAAITAFLFAVILDSPTPLTPISRTFLLILFAPELFRRIWVALPSGPGPGSALADAAFRRDVNPTRAPG